MRKLRYCAPALRTVYHVAINYDAVAWLYIPEIVPGALLLTYIICTGR